MASKNNAVKVAMATHKRFAEGDLETIINSWSKAVDVDDHISTSNLSLQSLSLSNLSLFLSLSLPISI